jgi:hypothetical protein
VFLMMILWPPRLLLLLQAAFPLTLVVSRDPRGVFVLLTLLDLLSTRIWDDTQACEPGLQVKSGRLGREGPHAAVLLAC